MGAKFCLGLLVALCIFQRCEASGKIEILMLRFQSSCTEHAGVHPCDTYFKFCIDRQRAPNINRCLYKKARSSDFDDLNTMEFGTNINGVQNPMVASISSFQSSGLSDVMFSLEAWDKDFWTGDDHVVTLSMNLSYTSAPSRNEAKWKSASKGYGSAHMWLSYRFYCDAFYYTAGCNVYCKARDDQSGHYTCREGTGTKRCMKGWKGENCNVDIDECEIGVCYHNAPCTNTPGSYSCACPQGYAGKHCDMVDTLCHSSPCQHGGNCTGTLEEYNCTCPFEWKGKNCETQVDFCNSSPCQNNATCYATLGNYTCACAPGWEGDHCTVEVNACEGSPCQNGGVCTKQPAGKYECSCPEQYEGVNCQGVKNPCDPDPCSNSGTCSQLTYDTFNCSCVYGWVGDNCEGFLNVSSSTQQQSRDDEPEQGASWVPIFIAVISAILIVAGIAILLFIRRRRRQKKAAEAFMERSENHMGVVHVAGEDNLSFRNALYDQTNRANSALEAQSCRPPLPLPTPTPNTCEDAFNFTKPKVLDEDEEEGAVGGYNPYQELDGYQAAGKYVDMKGGVDGGKENFGDSNPRAGATGLDTRTMAGSSQYKNSQGPASNPYADFEELKRNSMAVVKEVPGYANAPDTMEVVDETEENHYTDLDDLFLDTHTPPPDSTPSLRPPLPSTASHYDTPRSLSSDISSAGYDVPPKGRDLSPPEQAAGDGYMPMEGSTLPRDQLESLDSSDEEDGEAGNQEDIEKLRQEVMQSTSSKNDDY